MFRALRHFGTSSMAAAPVKPLVAIVGATGTGKSDLAVEIARKYNGEIINGDAMQLYQGLPIITNKIPQEEMKGIPHHLLGCIGLEEETWTVGKFVSKALRVIDEVRSRGKLPILVGGTHYYTQSLLFKDALSEEPLFQNSEDRILRFPILDEPTQVILAKLKEVDPVMAERWHPNERRKIQRSLEIYLTTGKPASQIYEEQRLRRDKSSATASGEDTEVGLRCPTLLLWVHASKDELYSRLDGRVDKMIDKGLLSEVQTLTEFALLHEARTGAPVDLGRGIWVSIGYKEFLNYQATLSASLVSDEELAKMRITAIEKTQAATRQYAKRQVRWIQIKLLNALINAGAKNSMFLVDGSDLSNWEEAVITPASEVTKQFLLGQSLPPPPELSPAAQEMLTPKRNYDLAQRPDLWQKKVCDTCGIVSVNENDWNLHVKSRAHRRAVGVKKKKLENSKDLLRDNAQAVQKKTVDVLESYLNIFPDEDSK